MKDLEIENSRLREAIVHLTLDKLISQEASWRNVRALLAEASASTMSGVCRPPPSPTPAGRSVGTDRRKARRAAATRTT
ncbi:hypothetical protein [Lichenibacterium ramalinae]|uniref:hypothetical protein n=1 Tax=Lichenibacterium ramalinae TaxID=2316527 RepID=UPI0013EDEB5E